MVLKEKQMSLMSSNSHIGDGDVSNASASASAYESEFENSHAFLVEFDEKDLGEWIIYEPLLAGLRVHNRVGIFFTVCLIWRRIIMLMVAMFLSDYAWIQVIVFVECSLFMCIFIGHNYPFIKVLSNQIELFNEIMIM